MDLICIPLLLFQFVFLVRIVMTFFPIAHDSPAATARDLAVAVTDPVVWPLRRALPPLPGAMAGFGIAELVVLLGLFVLTAIFC